MHIICLYTSPSVEYSERAGTSSTIAYILNSVALPTISMYPNVFFYLYDSSSELILPCLETDSCIYSPFTYHLKDIVVGPALAPRESEVWEPASTASHNALNRAISMAGSCRTLAVTGARLERTCTNLTTTSVRCVLWPFPWLGGVEHSRSPVHG